MVGPRALTVAFFVVVGALTCVAVARATVAAAAAAATVSSAPAAAEPTNITTMTADNGNSNRLDQRAAMTVDSQPQQSRKFRHEGSAVRILYQIGVSIFDLPPYYYFKYH